MISFRNILEKNKKLKFNKNLIFSMNSYCPSRRCFTRLPFLYHPCCIFCRFFWISVYCRLKRKHPLEKKILYTSSIKNSLWHRNKEGTWLCQFVISVNKRYNFHSLSLTFNESVEILSLIKFPPVGMKQKPHVHSAVFSLQNRVFVRFLGVFV